MGCNLYIGEAEADIDWESRYARVVVRAEEIEGAPLNSSDDHSNRVFPSYSAWADFCRRASLYAVFFARARGSEFTEAWVGSDGRRRDGIIYSHPGAVALTEAHYQAFLVAKQDYPPEGGGEEAEYDRRRLAWLVWWTRWALDNCKYPTFYNS